MTLSKGSERVMTIYVTVWTFVTFALGTALIGCAIFGQKPPNEETTIAQVYATALHTIYNGKPDAKPPLPVWVTLGESAARLQSEGLIASGIVKKWQEVEKLVTAPAAYDSTDNSRKNGDIEAFKRLQEAVDNLREELDLHNFKTLEDAAMESRRWVTMHERLLNPEAIDALLDDEQARHGFAHRRFLGTLLIGAGLLCFSLVGMGILLVTDIWASGAPLVIGALLMLGGVFMVDQNDDTYSQLPRELIGLEKPQSTTTKTP